MPSPIQNKMNTVFIHVTDLKTSVSWYNQLLGRDYSKDEIHLPVYNIQIEGSTGLTLDAGPDGNKRIIPDSYPIFNFHTDCIESAYQFVKNDLNYALQTEPVHFEDFSFFNVIDPDGHVIMICTG
ncbi:VOC family protein [Jeotgalibacillus sp. S-D1]|uniref:VOC family protein n=1 Tax=Jeotgalibacillus sp. S-D1 TaxID=2552189 RepID=UPI001059FBA8|nr:VOC family protein [Jeotgalibacillus sp. S-D1]TDL30907.1 VOC family protein [Jeotgalibacillus sp. S-D1]